MSKHQDGKMNYEVEGMSRRRIGPVEEVEVVQGDVKMSNLRDRRFIDTDSIEKGSSHAWTSGVDPSVTCDLQHQEMNGSAK